MRHRRFLWALIAALALALPVGAETDGDHPDVRLFFQAAAPDDAQAAAALAALADAWRDDYAALVVDVARFMVPRQRSTLTSEFEDRPAGPTGRFSDSAARREVRTPDADRPGTTGGAPAPGGAPEHPTTRIRERLMGFLAEQTGQDLGDDLRAWRRWYWARPYQPHPDYAAFKAALYRQVDEKMAQFFPAGHEERIRLDEIDWGGVDVNGIPPLDHPQHLAAREAKYLKDKHVVYGIAINGQARAYPQRILAWHELAIDEVGGVELTIVYCTLCGTVVPYGSKVGDEYFTFGTSGLLYRSNKLLFDAETMSLWSTVEGRPVVGPLARTDLELTPYAVVTTTWGEWKALHPDTTVLSLETGFDRDYSEGAAYRDYFRNDQLMFAVPKLDDRLKNKDEVLALTLRPAGGGPEAERRALAIAAKFLGKKKNRLFHHRFAGHDLVVITSEDGANRVYDAGSTRFVAPPDKGRLRAADGGTWRLTEEALVAEAEGTEPKPRIAARRAFWFGWYAQYPETELVK